MAAQGIAFTIAAPWYIIDGGGAMHGTSNDGRFVLSGTIGQPDAGVITGGSFKLTGGFWFEMPRNDCNGNGIIELADHAGFVDCLSGPDGMIHGFCHCFDLTGNERVDLLDFAETQRALGKN